MKLLVDANLSWRICKKIAFYFSEVIHVSNTTLDKPATDKSIWDFAKTNGYTILTCDIDFQNMSVQYSFPPKVIRIKSFRISTDVASQLILSSVEKILDFEINKTEAFLEIIDINL